MPPVYFERQLKSLQSNQLLQLKFLKHFYRVQISGIHLPILLEILATSSATLWRRETQHRVANRRKRVQF